MMDTFGIIQSGPSSLWLVSLVRRMRGTRLSRRWLSAISSRLIQILGERCGRASRAVRIPVSLAFQVVRFSSTSLSALVRNHVSDPEAVDGPSWHGSGEPARACEQRLGKASARRIAVDEVMWMLGEYESHYPGEREALPRASAALARQAPGATAGSLADACRPAPPARLPRSAAASGGTAAPNSPKTPRPRHPTTPRRASASTAPRTSTSVGPAATSSGSSNCSPLEPF